MPDPLGFQDIKRLWLKAAIEGSGRTQADIAAAMGMSPANLSALVNGHKGVTDDTIDKAVEAMSLEVPTMGIKIQLPALEPKGIPITPEQVEELITAGKTTARLLNQVLDRVEKLAPK